MSGNEIMVSVVFLLLGYWIVSFFLQGKPKGPGQEAQPSMQTWPGVLKVDPNASIDEIRAAYQTLMSQYHPDKVAALGAELRDLAERKSKEITVSYREALRSRDLGE